MIDFFAAIKNSDQYRKIEVDELLFAEYTCMQDRASLGIWSDNNYFVHILSGKKKWKAVGKSFEVVAGDVLFVKKGANITYQYFTDDFCAIFIFMPDEFIRHFIQFRSPGLSVKAQDISAQDPVIPVKDQGLLKSYFQSIRTFLHVEGPTDTQLLRLKFEELLFSALANDINSGLRDYFISLTIHTGMQLRYIMEQNFIYNLKLEEFARLSSRSLSAFKRDFKVLYRTTPGKWLLQKRLQHAKALLQQHGMNVTEAAYESGFENLSHFSRAFKTAYGVSPSDIRSGILDV